jgi:hypothetical protein
MNRFAGKNRSAVRSLRYAMILLLSLPIPTMAELTASVDRREIALGETLRLTLMGDAGRATSGNKPDAPEPGLGNSLTLQRDQCAVLSTVRIRSPVLWKWNSPPYAKEHWVFPSLTSGGRRTTPVSIRVNPEPVIAPGDALVLFEASLDQPAYTFRLS